MLPRNPAMLFLIGPGRCGKNTVGEYLHQRHGFAQSAIAKPLYDAVQAAYGLTVDELNAPDKERVIARVGKSLRELLQTWGDQLRQMHGPDVLLDRMKHSLEECGKWESADIVVTDGRLGREIEWARKHFASVWWITRPGPSAAIRDHSTERIESLRSTHYRPGDITLSNDGTLEQLYEQADEALAACGLRDLHLGI
jgi:hypothetical protein